MRADDITTPCNAESAKRGPGRAGPGRQAPGDSHCKEKHLGFLFFFKEKHLQTQQDEQGNVVHASLHPLLQRHGAAAVSIDGRHHVFQNL